MTAKEKRLRKEAHDAITRLIHATVREKDSFERTMLFIQTELAIAVGSLAALGMDKRDGEDSMANLAAEGLEIYRRQFDMVAELTRQKDRPQ